MDMDIAPIEQWRLDAETDGARADIGCRRRNRFLHHVAQIARDRHLALAGHHDTFDGEQLAAHIGPRQASDNADLIVGLDLAVAILRHAEKLLDGFLRDLHRLLLGDHQLLHRLAGKG